jgi:putative intracellular protease/amidase
VTAALTAGPALALAALTVARPRAATAEPTVAPVASSSTPAEH